MIQSSTVPCRGLQTKLKVTVEVCRGRRNQTQPTHPTEPVSSPDQNRSPSGRQTISESMPFPSSDPRETLIETSEASHVHSGTPIVALSPSFRLHSEETRGSDIGR